MSPMLHCVSVKQGFSEGLCRSFRPCFVQQGGLSEPPVLQVGPPDLVHHAIHVLLRQEAGQDHVEIVRLNRV